MVHKKHMDLVEQYAPQQNDTPREPRYTVVVTSTKDLTMAYCATSGELLKGFKAEDVTPDKIVDLKDEAPAGGNAYGVKVPPEQVNKLRLQ